ncbi:MAG: aspartate aminotransferase family protein [Aigarchaeota archaeon]|nr:aspartate aminotransferase family protein [Aigarchaeota archaeon]MCX8193579.1 aspartate aminotransferase family protein [Nitrososphaeria archaeon]MDW7986554.1 aspartate aminotransferase family protein [Nitrososphaerota archaeon]
MSGFEDIVEITRKHVFGTWRVQKTWKPVNIVSAEGCYFTDSSGKKYLDLSSQLICVNLGHSNMNVINAIYEYMKKLQYLTPAFACDVRAELSRMLLEIMPKNIIKFFYSTSGTEAVEAALKIARMYTRKHKIISRYRSYHGSTAASISITGELRRIPVEGYHTVPGTQFAPECYCYRCPFKLSYPECGITCAEYIDYMLQHEGDVAAVIVEPVVGSNGVIVPPHEYLPRLREITRDHNVLLIVDEVMSGWLRTGEWFAVHHWKIEPDIMVTAKGVTSGYLPLGVTGVSREISEYFEENLFAHGHTYEAHPVTLAAGIATINEYKRLNIRDNVLKVGEYLGKRLKELEAHPSVGEVRGLGMFWAIDLTRDKKTKKFMNTPKDKLAGRPIVVEKVAAKASELGVFIIGWVNNLLVAPPLIATREDIDRGVEVLDEALKLADQEASSKTS